MAEAVAGDVVVLHLGHQLGFSGSHCALRSVLQRLGPPGALPVNPGRRSGLELAREGRPLVVGDARSEADMVEQAVVVVEAKQQRADLLAVVA